MCTSQRIKVYFTEQWNVTGVHLVFSLSLSGLLEDYSSNPFGRLCYNAQPTVKLIQGQWTNQDIGQRNVKKGEMNEEWSDNLCLSIIHTNRAWLCNPHRICYQCIVSVWCNQLCRTSEAMNLQEWYKLETKCLMYMKQYKN